MADNDRLTAAVCRTCGKNLSVEEFRACAGVGHFCSAHLPAGVVPRSATSGSPRARRTGGSRGRGQGVSASGAIEYSCKGQFARDGVTRAGKLTSDHPSCVDGGVVFVCDGIGYGPGEIATLFIRDSDGRDLARRAGYSCRE